MSESSYGRLRIQMNKAFDIGVESLSRSGGAENGGPVPNPQLTLVIPTNLMLVAGSMLQTAWCLVMRLRRVEVLVIRRRGGRFFWRRLGAR